MSIRSRGTVAAILASVFAIGAAAAPVAAATPITFHVDLGTPCVDGTAPANAKLTITLKTDTGVLRFREHVMADSAGRYFVCSFATSTLIGINGGDLLTATAGNATHSWRIPRITIAVDRVTDRVTGIAPARTALRVAIQKQNLQGLGRTVAGPTVVAGVDGRYRANLATLVDLTGGDSVSLSAVFGHDSLDALAYVPFVMITRGSDMVVGASNPVTLMAILLGSPTDPRAVGLATNLQLNVFEASLRNRDGAPAYPRRGEHLFIDFIDGAGDNRVDLTIPAMGLRGDPATDVVSGRCMHNAPYTLRVIRDPDFSLPSPPEFVDEFFHGRTGGDGMFHRDITSRLNLRIGDQLHLICQYKSGDLLAIDSTAERAVP